VVRALSRLRSPLSGAAARLRLTGTLALGQVVGRGALALALLVLVRELPVDDFGDLALILALVAVTTTVADAGFGRLLVRDVSRGGPASAALVTELMRVRSLAVGTVVLLSGVALALVPTTFPAAVILLALAYLAFEATAYGFENAAVGAERPWRFVGAQGVSAIALLGGTVALALGDAATLTSAMAVLVGASTLKVVSHLLAWRRRDPPGPDMPRQPVRTLLRQALPFLGLTLLATVYYRIGIVALYAVRGAEETASYAAAFRIVDAIAIVAGVAFSGVSPALSRVHRDRPGEIWQLWLRMVSLAGSAVVPVALLALLVAEPLCGLLFGSEYRESAGEDLRFLVPGIALMVPQALSAAVVFMANDHGAVLRLTAANVTACIVASIVGADAFGSEGAALALSLAEALSFLSFTALIRNRYRPRRGHAPAPPPFESPPPRA
jgi:O-antigen/teichoic acid export membrane protein